MPWGTLVKTILKDAGLPIDDSVFADAGYEEIYIEADLPAGSTVLEFNLTRRGGIVDWGDGTIDRYPDMSGNVPQNASHTYAAGATKAAIKVTPNPYSYNGLLVFDLVLAILYLP